MSTTERPGAELSGRLGYLLKHAQLRMAELNAEALRPHGIDGRELGVLVVLAGGEPASQQQAAQRLGIDRTTMVAMLDTLEGKGLVSRHPHAEDRRRNVVELTERGRVVLGRALEASDEAERRFLASLSTRAAQQFRDSLRAIVAQRQAGI
ncbi:MarR family winged helix-turn-helix transcriptional regulator [Amycolatopsis thermophila]|uniref:DNA-binding MarR family transcriptional regulator n=1 Tax=Amycolatopsis thermophila TaxID=206084 RepID=A0ABU0ETT0_9PSEU|nr:MarR family transcriptional regulator [Amycolatopsis thermophila]MDQ0378701.1 DNA-binding MarR family transcriptional regulator [Amycolatopsis thermophila]